MQQEEVAKRELREGQQKKNGSKVKSKVKQQAAASKAVNESEGLQEQVDTEGQGEHTTIKPAEFQGPGATGYVGNLDSRGRATSAAAAPAAQSARRPWCEQAQTLDSQRQEQDEQRPLPWRLADHSRGQQQEKQQTKGIDIKQQQEQQRARKPQQRSQQATNSEQTQQQKLQQSQGGFGNSSSSSKGRPSEQGTVAGYRCSTSATATAAAPEASYAPAKLTCAPARDTQKGLSCDSPFLGAPVAQISLAAAVTGTCSVGAASLLPPHLAQCLEARGAVLPLVPVPSASATAAVNHHHQLHQGLDQQPCTQRHQQYNYYIS